MRKDRFARRKDKRRMIARERIEILLALAEEAAVAKKYDRAGRYAYLARKIGKRYNVRMPSGFKARYCKHCGTYRIPGRTSRTRIHGGWLIVHCLKCGKKYSKPVKEASDG